MCTSVCASGVCVLQFVYIFFFFNDTATTEIYTLSLHDALPILWNWESLKTVRIQSSSKMGFACAETQARHARPAASLRKTKEKPGAQTKRTAMTSLLKAGEAATASRNMGGKAQEVEIAVVALGAVHT